MHELHDAALVAEALPLFWVQANVEAMQKVISTNSACKS